MNTAVYLNELWKIFRLSCVGVKWGERMKIRSNRRHLASNAWISAVANFPFLWKFMHWRREREKSTATPDDDCLSSEFMTSDHSSPSHRIVIKNVVEPYRRLFGSSLDAAAVGTSDWCRWVSCEQFWFVEVLFCCCVKWNFK